MRNTCHDSNDDTIFQNLSKTHIIFIDYFAFNRFNTFNLAFFQTPNSQTV
ncbi:hypothetical protein Scep_000936 [Stephania cephalantha]|uniref:Uncharacterized protein n=1 Tax=Stephania cephalantha TaxID=152367 RepID=A0AAP0Q3C5_9MAGN